MSWRDRALIRAATAFAGAALLAAGGPAAADSRTGGGPNWNVPQSQSRPASAPTAGAAAIPRRAPAAYSIVVVVRTERPQTSAASVAIRGPDGTVRTYQLEEGASVIQPPQITIRAGEAVTLRFLPPAPAR
jgi:hypothetical protein